jgi:hypothetical protein
VALVEATTPTRQKGVVVHGVYMQGTQVTRYHNPSRVVKNMGIKKPKNPAILYGVPSEIVPRKGTMLEFKTHLPVASPPLFPDMQLESIPPVQVSAGMVMMPQEEFTSTLAAQQSTMLAPPHYEAALPASPHYSLQYPPCSPYFQESSYYVKYYNAQRTDNTHYKYSRVQ